MYILLQRMINSNDNFIICIMLAAEHLKPTLLYLVLVVSLTQTKK